MVPIVIEVWLPYDEVLMFWFIFFSIAVVARTVWRLIPVVGG